MSSSHQDNVIDETLDDSENESGTEEDEMRLRPPLKRKGHKPQGAEEERGCRKISRTTKGIKPLWFRDM